MQGDFSRFTFDRRKHYTGVRLQQGRVQLDADWNEQLDIASYLRRTLTADLVGPSGAPTRGGGFEITVDRDRQTLLVSPGRYYVDGLLCENEAPAPLPIDQQPDLPGFVFSWLPAGQEQVGWYMAYLDVWEASVSALEDPDLLEVALGGPDTSTRARTVWQVRLIRLGPEDQDFTCASFPPPSLTAAPPTLTARTQRPPDENQLYRVEVHTPGPAGTATFKWSRDNGAVTALIEEPGRDPSNPFNLVISRQIGPDQGGGFAADQWIEVTDERRLLHGEPGVLAQIGTASGQALTLTGWPPSGPPQTADRPLIRRWDGGGATGDQTIPADDSFVPLEGGLEVSFRAAPGSVFRSGDFWTIPVRAGAGALWPEASPGVPASLPPQGIVHHYAPLALLRQRMRSADGTDGWTLAPTAPCRRTFEPSTLGTGQEKLNRTADDTMTASLTITGALSVKDDVTVGPPNTTARLKLLAVPLEPATGEDLERAGIRFTGLTVRGGAAALGSIRFFGTPIPFSTQVSAPRLVLAVQGLESSIALQQEGTDVLTVAGGNVGIGVAKGVQKLHVEGGALFRPGTSAGGVVIEAPLTLKDGTQGAGRLLVSDVNGRASWKETPLIVGSPVFLPQHLFVAGGGGGPLGWTTYALAADKVPAGVKAVILQAQAAKADPDRHDIDGRMFIRRGPDDPANLLMRGRSSGGGDSVAWANQGTFPLKDNTFQFSITGSGFGGGWDLMVIGYFP